MKKIFWFIICLILFVSPVANAETNNFVGKGYFYFDNEKNIDYNKTKAKEDGIRNICEQIKFFIKSDSEMKNYELTNDEIVIISENFVRISDIQYNFEMDNQNDLMIIATVNAEIDDNDIKNFLENKNNQ